MSKKYTMEEYVDILLFDKKPAKKKKIEESEVDVKDILEAEVPPAETAADIKNPPPAQNQQPQQQPQQKPAEEPKPKEEIPDKEEERDLVKKTIEKIKKTLKDHKSKGDMVEEIAMSLQGQDVGKYEVGVEEYATITNFKIIFSKFGINFKELPDSIKSFSVSTEEKVSQSNHNNVSLMVEMADEETLGIQLFVGDEGIPFDEIEDAIKEFDKQYQINIVSTINKKVRA